MNQLDSQTVGNVGLYYTCYRLSLLGWNVMPTARNARGIDIVAYERNGGRYLGFQVKALSRRNAVPLGGNLERVMGDFWVIVTKATTEPVVYILPPKEVRENARRVAKDGRSSYWLPPPKYEVPRFRDAWNRITRRTSTRRK